MQFPKVNGWISKCAAVFDSAFRAYVKETGSLDELRPVRGTFFFFFFNYTNLLSPVIRAHPRNGSQIDTKAFSTDVRRAAEVVKAINADYKKKMNQRQKEQLEKEKKDEKKDEKNQVAEVLSFTLPGGTLLKKNALIETNLLSIP